MNWLVSILYVAAVPCLVFCYWEGDRQRIENPSDNDIQCTSNPYCNKMPDYMNWRLNANFEELASIEANNEIKAKTEHGTVRGLSVPGVHDISSFVNIYLGIPYAKPPINEDRFKFPQPAEDFPDMYDATYYRPACPQMYDFVQEDIPGFTYTNEDCLYLNVFQPNRTNGNYGDDDYPVLVFIHGGQFKKGSAIQYPGIVLAQRDMVVVTFNYRLGPLGFLTTGDEHVRGNMGLFDQRMALQWVKQNIHNFHGLPDSVTVVGHEAGAASVGIHMLSPMTRGEGLFKRAIMMSGSDLSPWAVIPRKNFPQEYTMMLSQLVGCGREPGDGMVRCLRTKHPQSLIAAAEKVSLREGETAGPFVPTVDYIEGKYEGWLLAEPEVLRKDPNNIMNIDVLGGFAKDDGAYILSRNFSYNFSNIQAGLTLDEFRWVVENVTRRRGARDVRQVADAVEFLYTWWPNPDNGTARRKMLIDVFTDELYASGIDLALKSHARRNERTGKGVYMYKYDYRSETDNKTTYWMGSYYNYDVQYLFGWPYLNKTYQMLSSIHLDKQYSELDRNISNGTMRMWKDFAKTGTPTQIVLDNKELPWNFRNLTWYPMKVGNLTYFELDYNCTNEKEYSQSQLGFWQDYIWDILHLEVYTTTPVFPTDYPYEHYQVATFALAGLLFITLIIAVVVLIALIRRNPTRRDYY